MESKQTKSEGQSQHRDDVVDALVEGEQSGLSSRIPEDIRYAVRREKDK